MNKKLYEMAYARGGDKGAHANIGIITYSLEQYHFLNSYLTEEKVFDFFKSMGVRKVEKYPLENLWAINFVLKGILGKGGSCSLLLDSQGKALGQALLEMEITLDKPKTQN